MIESTRCPACHEQAVEGTLGGRLLGFNWRMALAGELPEFAPFVPAFVGPRLLRNGDTLYHCAHCGLPWLLYRRSAMMCAVEGKAACLIEEWNRAPLPISHTQRQALAGIGGTPSDVVDSPLSLWFPCRLRRADGSVLDPAILMLNTSPPGAGERLLAADDVIEATDFALSLPIRAQSRRAEECRMSFAPYAIRHRESGERFILNGGGELFHYDRLRGCDMLPDPMPYRPGDSIHPGTDPCAWFRADCPERLAGLIPGDS